MFPLARRPDDRALSDALRTRKQFDGVDLLPHLTGAASGRPHQTLYWRIDGMWAVRDGDWKLVHGQAGKEPPELFDLAKDLGEKNNLAATNPEKVKELQARWDAWNLQQANPDQPKDRAAKAEKRKAKKKRE